MRRPPHDILGVGAHAAREEIVAAYRKLAMKWHPDRNSAPDAKEKFQEIQNAYQTLQNAMPPPLDVNQMWEDIADQPQDDKEEVGEEENTPPLPERWTEEVPWVSAAAMLAGAVGALLSSWPNDLILFSLSVAVAAAAYKTGNSDIAIRSGAAFRILTRLYFLFLLAWCVWSLAKEVVGG